MPARRAIYFANVFFFFIFYIFCGQPQSNEFSGTTVLEGSSLTFQELVVELCKSLINSSFILQSLKGRRHGYK